MNSQINIKRLDKPLRLTTTEAYSLIGDFVFPEKHSPIIKAHPDWSFVYLSNLRWTGYIHGEAEQLAKFDIPQFLDGQIPEEEGIFENVELWLPDKVLLCQLFQWIVDGKYRALIVALNNEQDYLFALSCFQAKTDNL